MKLKPEFLQAYRESLEHNITENPERYGLITSIAEHSERIFGIMTTAIESKGFGAVLWDSQSFKLACKKLGIKHTMKTMTEYNSE